MSAPGAVLHVSLGGRQPGLRTREALRAFLHMEAAGGVVLVVAAALALWTANSPLASGDADLLHLELRLGVGRFSSTENLQHWVND